MGNQNVQQDYWNVYEFRVPRSRFSGDRLDAGTEELLYSDAVGANRAGNNVIDTDTLAEKTDTSIWDLDFTKVTMYRVLMVWCCWCSIPCICPCKQWRSTLGTCTPFKSI